MDISSLDVLVRNEAIEVLKDSGFKPEDISSDRSLVDQVMPQMIQGRIAREAAILNNARRNVHESLSLRYALEWQKQALWAEERLTAYHDLGERYPIAE